MVDISLREGRGRDLRCYRVLGKYAGKVTESTGGEGVGAKEKDSEAPREGVFNTLKGCNPLGR